MFRLKGTLYLKVFKYKNVWYFQEIYSNFGMFFIDSAWEQ